MNLDGLFIIKALIHLFRKDKIEGSLKIQSCMFLEKRVTQFKKAAYEYVDRMVYNKLVNSIETSVIICELIYLTKTKFFNHKLSYNPIVLPNGHSDPFVNSVVSSPM